MHRSRPFAIVLSLALGALVACSTTSGQAGTRPTAAPAVANNQAAQAVTVQGTDALKFEPSTITVPCCWSIL